MTKPTHVIDIGPGEVVLTIRHPSFAGMYERVIAAPMDDRVPTPAEARIIADALERSALSLRVGNLVTGGWS